ncbi:MAG: fused MFS/spermidine synthase [Planctomycetaceae bacterium]|nr:fused MFS/spermidine synthase [Planctomycetaceae bacterium]
MRIRLASWLYALTIFVSAFLLFQIQPLISKCLLPWFGGTPNVWTTCMLFFQAVLFGGYLYAHVLTQKFRPPVQALIHLLLLLATVLALQILPGDEGKPDPGRSPVGQILFLLTITVGLPYFVLSTTGPLLQSWFSRSLPGQSPYRLYALSNAGSLLALVSYPFLFEPLIGMTAQAAWWTLGFGVFALLCGGCAWAVSKVQAPVVAEEVVSLGESRPRLTLGRGLGWFALAMTASVMLLATTNQVCLDVAVVPFLWVVPLGLYLLTFIVCFEREQWYSRKLFGLAGALAMVLTTFLLMQEAATSLLAQVTTAFGAMFLCCMVCHGELVKRKPGPESLTAFYLIISAGGACGGLFVGLIAPLIFPLYLEMHLSIAICCGLALWVYLQEKREREGRTEWIFRFGSVATVLGVAVALQVQADDILDRAAAVRRNFYGVLRVEHEQADDPEQHVVTLRYGRILHGLQFAAEQKQRLATTYYGPGSGIGRVVARLQAERPRLRIGVVGLGVGTLATYGREGDVVRFYEINPDVIALAREHFTFLADSPAEVEIITGDARLTLEREPAQEYDLLVLDAFSGDAIPTHLLTEEALDVYRRHIRPDGVLAVHISNLHFDLRPVVASLAEQCGLAARLLLFSGDHASGQTGSLWFAAAGDAGLFDDPRLKEIAGGLPDQKSHWTDDFSDLFTLLR